MAEYAKCEKVEENPVDKMNDDVDQMIADNIIPAKVIIQSKTDVCHRSQSWGLKPGIV
jgi:hypothetical protein